MNRTRTSTNCGINKFVAVVGQHTYKYNDLLITYYALVTGLAHKMQNIIEKENKIRVGISICTEVP